MRSLISELYALFCMTNFEAYLKCTLFGHCNCREIVKGHPFVLMLLQFLRILSEEEDSASSSNTAEDKLSEAVENLALKFEGASSSVKEEEPSASSVDLAGLATPQGALVKVLPSCACDRTSQELGTSLASTNGQEELPVLREDYFSSSPRIDVGSISNSFKSQEESKGSLGEALGSETLGKNQLLRLEDDHALETVSTKGNFLTQRRKVAVLYELLSAAVADTPAEDGEDVSRTRRGYDARQRVALRLLATWLDVKWSKMVCMFCKVPSLSEFQDLGHDDSRFRDLCRQQWRF